MTQGPVGTWLLIGGAGYIGSHTAWDIKQAGGHAIIFDNLSTGLAERIPPSATLIQGDAADHASVIDAIETHNATGIMHFAARKQARESVRRPMDYWNDNLMPLLGVVRAAQDTSIQNFILSSSCSVYGAAQGATEATAMSPLSPYARTKMVSELIVRDVLDAAPTNWCALRYFNFIGNANFPNAVDTSEECLVPAVTRRILSRQQPIIFGTSYQSKDGTALRDYVDVRDLAAAHTATARWMIRFGALPNPLVNVGTGTPRSVLEIVDHISELLDWSGGYSVEKIQTGDPGPVYAQPSAFLASLEWKPQFSLRESLAAHCQNL